MTDFWSRRKAGVAAEEKATRKAEVEAEAQADAAALEEQSDEEILAALNMPPPEEMETPDQITTFLRETIPARLRQRALRRLWRLNPVLANLDGLNDYDDDYTGGGVAAGLLRTDYQVGRGLIDKFAPLVVEDDAEDADDPDDPEPEAEVAHAPEPQPVEVKAEVAEEEATELAATQRRMRFRFEKDLC